MIVSFITCIHHLISLGRLNPGARYGWDMYHAWEDKETQNLVRKLQGKSVFRDQVVDWGTIS
jgi:hypothetical protein